MSFSRTSVLLGGAALAAVIVGVVGSQYLKKNGNADDELLPALTEEEVTKIMSDILMQLKVLAARMARGAENIKQQLQQQGQDMDNMRIMKNFILPHFESQFAEMQAQVFFEHDVEEEEVEDAHNYYSKHGNKQLNEIGETIKDIYKQFGGDLDDDMGDESGASMGGAGSGSKEMTLDVVLDVLHTLKDRMVEATEAYADNYLDNHDGPPTDHRGFEQFQAGLVKVSEQVEVSILEEYGYTQRDFQHGVLHHQHSQEINHIIGMMQTENHKILAAKGMNFMM